jgi:hypothetical protein
MGGTTMIVRCFREHNGSDTLLYAVDLPGAYARGENAEIALSKMAVDAVSWLRWRGLPVPETVCAEIVEEKASDLEIRDADSDALLPGEDEPLSREEYELLKKLVLKSAQDFQVLYDAIAEKDAAIVPVRRTFYGQIPRTALEMYTHTKNVNTYYFAEVNVKADNSGPIADCRCRGFAKLETQPDFLQSALTEGSYGELWSVRKVLRRFLWHDRIHAKALYRLACRLDGSFSVNPFCF